MKKNIVNNKAILFSMLAIILILCLSVSFAADDTNDVTISDNSQLKTSDITGSNDNSFTSLSSKINSSTNTGFNNSFSVGMPVISLDETTSSPVYSSGFTTFSTLHSN